MRALKVRILAFSCALLLCVVLGVPAILRGCFAGYILSAGVALLAALLSQTVAKYRAVRLILENKLHTAHFLTVQVGSSSVHVEGVDAIVSSFGIMVGDRIYRFNQPGEKLLTMGIDGTHIRLGVGTAKTRYTITLRHDFMDGAEVRAFAKEIWDITDVDPVVSGWDEASAEAHSQQDT